MRLWLAITLIAILATTAWIAMSVGEPKIFSEPKPPISQLHYYNQPSQPLKEIRLNAFYFIPQNKIDKIRPNWKFSLKNHLEKLAAFHKLQLRGQSSLTYNIYPQPIIGRFDHLAYDTEVTQGGNPEGLKRVTMEIEARVFNKAGDLYNPRFIPSPNTYNVTMVMYEGVGASGSKRAVFISSVFLMEPAYQIYGTSLLAHEFYHSLGVTEGYKKDDAYPTKNDVMGLGRYRPIEYTYLNRQTLKGFGL